MSKFKEMDPSYIWKILDERDADGNKLHQDILTDLASKESTNFSNVACPTCGGHASETFVNPARPFSSSSPLPNKLLRCTACRTEFDPFTRLVTRASPINSLLT